MEGICLYYVLHWLRSGHRCEGQEEWAYTSGPALAAVLIWCSVTSFLVVGLRGRAHDRVNRGRLGPKGMYAWQSMASKDRLTHPVRLHSLNHTLRALSF